MPVAYEQARHAVAERLTSGALEHSERVAGSAVSLAALYGVDEQEAALAGLLHDWHRETPHDVLVARARELGIEVTDVDIAVPYLLHGPVAEADLAERFPDLPVSVLRAVGSHTYGAPAISALGMVLFLADVIEPSRRQEGVDGLRDKAGVLPLEALFAEAYAHSLHHLIERRKRIHPMTLHTWNRIVAGWPR
ncbi:MAG: bis(5'-nucleosyl)-tetraphosphatase (symmetrical) YqeK [Coriobacteriia bacterium]